MAKVKWNDAIENVSGALKKINKKSQHAADQKMILAMHRTAETTNPVCTHLFVRGIESVTRKTPYKPEEIAAQTKFGAVAQAVQTRLHDMNRQAADQAAFKAQKKNGYKTMKSYIWALEAAAYDEHNAG